ncbi:MAG: hypothetical protein AAB404_01330 [Patescibacteria group bacterium]
MDIPDNIKYILERIYKSEDEWKALYMAIWYYHDYIKHLPEDPETLNRTHEDLINYLSTESHGTATVISLERWQREAVKKWEVTLKLPASKKPHHKYEINDLISILASRDINFALDHLQTLFSLLEELSDKASEILLSPQNLGIHFSFCKVFCKKSGFQKKEFRASRFNNLSNFLREQIGVSKDEIKELSLAKATRNCFIHNGSKIDNNWLSADKKIRGNCHANLLGHRLEEGFQPIFHQIEDWHDLIVNIAEKIKEKISQRN